MRPVLVMLTMLAIAMSACTAPMPQQGEAVIRKNNIASAVDHLPFSSGDPRTAITKAVAAAKKDGRLVLVNFGANWCLDCRVLERLFLTDPVKPFLESHFHVVTIDVGLYMEEGKGKNVDVSSTYGLNLMTSGVPAIVVLDSKGHTVATTAEGQWRRAGKFTTSDLMPFLEAWAQKR